MWFELCFEARSHLSPQREHQWTEHSALRGALALSGGLTHPEWTRSSNQEVYAPVKKGYIQVQQIVCFFPPRYPTSWICISRITLDRMPAMCILGQYHTLNSCWILEPDYSEGGNNYFTTIFPNTRHFIILLVTYMYSIMYGNYSNI